jgi:hypothetical protein
VIGYASRCSGRTAEALQRCGWGMLLTPQSRPPRPIDGMRYCIDNGAWGCYVHATEWDQLAFERIVREHGANADWIAAPDIVAGGSESLRLSVAWLDRLNQVCRRTLIPVQDGMTPGDLYPIVGPRVGIFVGGTTAWKLRTLCEWGALAEQRDCYLHVARVNSARRIRYCLDVGADSFDGSSVSRFRATLPRLDAARRDRQLAICWPHDDQ